MVKNVNYESRKRAVLSTVINKYIKEAVPVASEDIADNFDLSSATIRNIFAELEEAGYLTHPYTSAGKIPTDKGYRYYVDSLILQMELLDGEKDQVLKEYKKEMRRLEDTLERTSQVLSAITHYAGIVSFLEWQDKVFYKGLSFILEQPEFRDSEKMRILIKMIEDKEQLLCIINRDLNEKVKIYIGEEAGFSGMEGCSLVVSSYCLKNRPSGRLAVLGPVRMQYNHVISALEYVSDILTETLDEI